MTDEIRNATSNGEIPDDDSMYDNLRIADAPSQAKELATLSEEAPDEEDIFSEDFVRPQNPVNFYPYREEEEDEVDSDNESLATHLSCDSDWEADPQSALWTEEERELISSGKVFLMNSSGPSVPSRRIREVPPTDEPGDFHQVGGYTLDLSQCSPKEKAHVLYGHLPIAYPYFDYMPDAPPTEEEFESVEESARLHRHGHNIVYHMAENRKRTAGILGLIRRAKTRGSNSVRGPNVSRSYHAPTQSRLTDTQVVWKNSALPVSKPVSYDVKSFREWVHYESYKIKQSHRVPTLGPREIVLYHGFNGTVREANLLLQNAAVSATSWGAIREDPGSFDPVRRTVSYGDITIANVQELDRVQPYFKKHKPFFKAIKRFMQGDQSVDMNLDIGLLGKVFPQSKWEEIILVLRGNSSVPEKAFVLDTADFPPLAPRLQGIAMSQFAQVRDSGICEDIASRTVSRVTSDGATAILGAQFGRGVVDGVRSAITADDKQEIVRRFLNVILGITNLMQAQSVTHALGIALQTCVNDPALNTYLLGYKTVVEAQFQGKAKEKSEESIPWMVKICGMTSFGLFREFFGGAYEMFLGQFEEMCSVAKFATFREFGQKFASWFCEAMSELFSRVQACITQRSLKPLFGMDPGIWAVQTEAILRHAGYIQSRGDGKMFAEIGDSLPRAFRRHLNAEDFSEALGEHVASGEAIAKVIVVPAVRNSQAYLLRQLKVMKAAIDESLEFSSFRVCPFHVLLWGEPGAGKTTIAENMASAILEIEGRTSADLYHYMPGANFQTGLRNNTTVLRMDDPDSSMYLAGPGIEDHNNFLQKLVSNQPFEAEQADIASKGTCKPRIKDVITTSNFTHLHAKETSRDLTAIWRRVHMYVEVKPAPGVVDPVTGRMDPTRAAVTGDAQLFMPRAFAKMEKGVQTFTDLSPNWMTFKQFWWFYLARRKNHLQYQERLKFRSTGGKCPGCFLPFDYCVCDARPEGFLIPCAFCSNDECTCSSYQGGGLSRMSFPDSGPDTPFVSRVRSYAVRMGTEFTHDVHRYSKTVVDFFRKYPLGALATIGALSTAAALLTFYKATFQGRATSATVDSWFRADPVGIPALPAIPKASWTREDLVARLASAHCVVEGTGPGANRVHGYIFRNGWVIFPTHATHHTYNGLRSGIVKYRGSTYSFREDGPGYVRIPDSELSLFRISGLSGENGIASYMLPHISNYRVMDEASLHCGTKTYSFPTVEAGMEKTVPVWFYRPETQDGDCGGALIARTAGSNSFHIIGFHMWITRSYSMSVQSCGDLLTNWLARHEPSFVAFQQGAPRVPVSFLFPEEKQPALYPQKSELAVAQTFYNNRAVCWGTIAIAGSHFSTKFSKTSFHGIIKETADLRGISSAFEPPKFKGSMVPPATVGCSAELDEVYFSPYQHALRDSNTSEETYSDVIDVVVKRFVHENAMPLSELEALKGIPGKVNSINLNTSMGAPHNCPKKKHITPDRESISPELAAEVSEIWDILSQGKIPRIRAEATLKDEVLKTGKNARVFCVLPASFNIVCKQVFYPLKAAMRASYFRSGCAVGIDMGSVACADIVDWARSHQYLLDADCSRMDKVWTPQAWDAVAEVIRRFYIPMGEDLARIAASLVLAMKECIISIKGDLATLYWNISGNDITVELNSIFLLLIIAKTERVYQMRIDALTYGDDAILATFERPPDDLYETMTRISGVIFTDGNKSSKPSVRQLEEITFLQRTFRFDEEYKTWVAPLGLARIVKMLLYRGPQPATMSVAEHEHLLLETALRHLVLHGRQEYNFWVSVFKPYLPSFFVVPDYDETMGEYVKGTYTDWSPR